MTPNNDDYVGELIPTCLSAVYDYADANYEIRDQDHHANGRANLLNTTLSPAPPPCPPVPGGGPPQPIVTITGPTEVFPGAECGWVASVEGATGPISYMWYRDGQLVLEGSDTYVSTVPEPGFLLQVIASGYGGGGTMDSRTVVTNENAGPFCPLP
jgi:hypothetical protein